MTNSNWTWAELNAEQQALLADAERALGADYLLAFTPTEAPTAASDPSIHGLQAAPLSESEIECLSGLEAQLHTVVVAYRQVAQTE